MDPLGVAAVLTGPRLQASSVTGDLPAVKLGYIRIRTSDLDKLFPAIPTTRPEDRYTRW